MSEHDANDRSTDEQDADRLPLEASPSTDWRAVYLLNDAPTPDAGGPCR
jgi:hypothetical protein